MDAVGYVDQVWFTLVTRPIPRPLVSGYSEASVHHSTHISQYNSKAQSLTYVASMANAPVKLVHLLTLCRAIQCNSSAFYRHYCVLIWKSDLASESISGIWYPNFIGMSLTSWEPRLTLSGSHLVYAICFPTDGLIKIAHTIQLC